MKFLGMEEKGGGRFLHRYDLRYELSDGKEKKYEIVSRKSGMSTLTELNASAPDAVVLIVTDSAGERLLLNREYRMAVGGWVYNFPAGLIDPGEDIETAARRELFEETGLHLDAILETFPLSFGAVGISNESNVCVLCRASGDFAPSTSAEEEIEAKWFTKAELRTLLQTETFNSRTQTGGWWWSRE